jgi:hypothetical protein
MKRSAVDGSSLCLIAAIVGKHWRHVLHEQILGRKSLALGDLKEFEVLSFEPGAMVGVEDVDSGFGCMF